MPAAPSREAILVALEHLLAWPEIARSPQLARFLDYIVRHTLDGEGQAIKAYSIAVDVFGRSADFDPQADPIVRVQARRLRGLLEQYYLGPGGGETVEIRLPVGRYIPEFEERIVTVEPVAAATPAPSPTPTPRAARRPGVTVSWFVLIVLAVGIGLAAISFSTWGTRREGVAAAAGVIQQPSLTVVEFQNLAGTETGAPVVAGLAIELVTDLELFEDIDVRYGGAMTTAAGDGPSTDFVLTGIVRPQGDLVQYSAILTDRRSGEVVWNNTISISRERARLDDALDLVSRSLSLVLGSTRGPLHAAGRQVASSVQDMAGQANLYLCRILFDIYRENAGATSAERARQCLLALPELQASQPVAQAMSAIIEADFGAGTGNAASRFLAAEQTIAQAIDAAPTSAFVWEQQGWLLQGRGRDAEARSALRSSLQLNPASTDALAAYARLLAFHGDLDDARTPADEAVRGAPNPPAWYLGVPTLVALADKDGTAAVTAAERYAEADRELGPILAIMAGQAGGNGDVVNRYLPQVLEMPEFRARGVLTRLRERVSDDALLQDMRTALVAAGVPPASLISSF